MSLESLLKNVYTFLDVLQAALSDRAAGWEPHTIDNAIQWATYAQQMYIQASGKPYKAELDKKIQHIGQLPWVLGGLDVNLQLLQHAETLIKESLLQNPWLKDEVFEYILSLYDVASEEGMLSFIQVCQKLSKDKAEIELLHTLESTCGFDNDERSEMTNYAQAQLLVSFVTRALGKTPQHKKDRTLTFLRKNIVAYGSKPDAVPILALALKHKYPDILKTKEQENDTKTVILHAIFDLPLTQREELKPFLASLSQN